MIVGMKNKKPTEKEITIDKLAIMIQEGFMAMAKQEDLLALTERMDKFEKNVDMHFNAVLSEQKEIRKEIKVNDLKNRGDGASLDFRVSKLEKKAGF
jgi:uncharacterized coiled-coil protein SlyX